MAHWKHWTEEERYLLLNAFKRGERDEVLAERFQRSVKAIRRERQKMRVLRRPARANENETEYRQRRMTIRSVRWRGTGSGGHLDQRVEPTPEAVAERDRALSAPRTIEMCVFGDPLPGRSYLDRMRAGR